MSRTKRLKVARCNCTENAAGRHSCCVQWLRLCKALLLCLWLALVGQTQHLCLHGLRVPVSHTRTFAHTHLRPRTHAHKHTHTHTHAHTHTHTRTFAHTHPRTHAHKHTSTHTCTHAHAHTHTRTHTIPSLTHTTIPSEQSTYSTSPIQTTQSTPHTYSHTQSHAKTSRLVRAQLCHILFVAALLQLHVMCSMHLDSIEQGVELGVIQTFNCLCPQRLYPHIPSSAATINLGFLSPANNSKV